MIRTENYLRELFAIFFAQKHVIFWTTLLVFAGAILVVAFWPPMYGASGSILVSGKQVDITAPEALEKKPTARPFEISKEDLASELEILTSPDVIRNALRSLSPSAGDPPVERILGVRESLKATPVPASNVISVEYLSRDRREAVRVLDAVMANYLSYRFQFYRPATSQVTPPFLGEQAARQQVALEEKEQELVSLLDDTGVSSPLQEIENNIILKKRLEQELNILNGQYIELKATLGHLQQALEKKDLQYFAFLESPTITRLGEKLTELSAERGKLLRVYLPDSETVTLVEEQLRATFGSLKAEVQLIMEGHRTKLQGIAEKIARTEQAVGSYDVKNLEMQKQLLETEKIKREASLLQYSYEMLTKRKGEVEINDLMAPKDTATLIVSIMGQAFPSNGPVFPKPIVIPLGLLVGLITGISLGFLREFFDHTFKRPSEVVTYTGLHVLFSLAGPRESSSSTHVYLLGLLLMVVAMAIYLLGAYKILPIF